MRINVGGEEVPSCKFFGFVPVGEEVVSSSITNVKHMVGKMSKGESACIASTAAMR